MENDRHESRPSVEVQTSGEKHDPADAGPATRPVAWRSTRARAPARARASRPQWRARDARRLEIGAAAARRMLDLSAALPEHDRALVAAVFRRGMTAADVARVCGSAEWETRRRLARLVERMNRPEFIITAGLSDHWPRLRAMAARLCVIEGLGQRAAAGRLGVTVHAVRRELAAVRALAQAVESGGKLREAMSAAAQPRAPRQD